MFDNRTIRTVRNKWRIIPGYNPSLIRQDQCGAWMKFVDYWNRNSQYGWEIDHIIPVSHWWVDSIYNLRPLQWENNLYKSNGRLVCKVRAR